MSDGLETEPAVMAEFSSELQKKIHRVLGITPDALKAYDPAEIIDELCETVIMLDEDNVLPQLTSLREKLTAINGRIWNLLGKHDAKRARENLSGIAELERYVGEVKRKSGELEQVRERGRETVSSARQSENERRLNELEKRIAEIQEDLQKLVHMVMESEELEEEMRGVLAKAASVVAQGRDRSEESAK